MTPTSPINFRMPTELRARLRAFAKERHLGESDALKVILAEHFAELHDAHELAEAQAWQLGEVLKTLDEHTAGRGETVPQSEIDRIFREARRKAKSKRTA